MAQPVLSWGRVFRYDHDVSHLGRLSPLGPSHFAANKPTIIHGMGRSYGDVALNGGAGLCIARARDNILAFDRGTGVLRAQSGLTLAQLNAVTVPSGWITPVSPGTKYVTLGGAVANDVHGKNHHIVGSFGAHVRSLCLRRSNGDTLTCSLAENADLFNATISGLGLTGYIEWVEIQLMKISSTNLQIENHRYGHLDEFFEWSETSANWPYTAAWIDCFAPRSRTGAGIFTRARFAEDGILSAQTAPKTKSLPFELPSILLNKYSISSFNWAYKRRWGAEFKGLQNYQAFFYPLDTIDGWNKLYGRRGFYQHQSILPIDHARDGVMSLLDAIRKSGQGSFLAVLKRNGEERSPGLNTFPLDGVSLALDFPNRGEKTVHLLHQLDDIAVQYGGRMYPAKDATMTAETYQASYPNWQELERLRDPNILSSFWKRVTQQD